MAFSPATLSTQKLFYELLFPCPLLLAAFLLSSVLIWFTSSLHGRADLDCSSCVLQLYLAGMLHSDSLSGRDVFS